MKNDCVSHEGIVKTIDGQTITVVMTVQSACAACHAKGMCGASEQSNRAVTALNLNNETFEIGECVNVEMKEELATQAVLIGYLFPFLVLIITFFVIGIWSKNELVNVLIALSATAIYYLIIWKFNKKISKKFVFIATKKHNI